jgi:hypothetical protein
MAKQTFTTGQVLTAAQMTSLQQTAMSGGAASAKTASYTLVAADAGTAISMSNASATTITVNTALFAAGDTVQITNLGAGVCTITAGTATVNSSASLALAQYESGTLDFISTSAAIFIKGAGAAVSDGNLAQITTGSLSGSSVTLSSLSTYKELLLFIYGYTWGTTTSSLIVRVNNNSGANYSQFGWYDNAGVNGSPVKATGLTSFSNTYPESNQLNTNTDGVMAIKFTNCKSTGFTDMDQKSIFFRNTDSKYYSQTYKGVYSQSEAVSSLVITTSGGYTFSAGTYILFGA